MERLNLKFGTFVDLQDKFESIITASGNSVETAVKLVTELFTERTRFRNFYLAKLSAVTSDVVSWLGNHQEAVIIGAVVIGCLG